MHRIKLPVKNDKLKKYITDYYVVEFISDFNEPILVPPLGFPVLHFHYGVNGNFYNYQNTPNESVIIGQLTKHYLLSPHKGLKMIGINFKPYGMYNLLGLQPKELTDACIESKHIFGEETVLEIRRKLKKSNDEEKIELLEKLLIAYIEKMNITQNHIYDEMVDFMIERNGMVGLKEVVNNKISTRTLERYFSKVIGISPKLFCQILRHKLIMQLTYENQEFNWQDAIFMGYYHDHSHLSRDFVKFSNMKPTHYLTEKNHFSDLLLKT